MSISWSTVFANLGALIRPVYKHDTQIDTIEAESVKRQTQFAGAGDMAILQAGLKADQDTISALESAITRDAGVVKRYLREDLPDEINSAHEDVDDIVRDLYDRMTDDSESVDACAVSCRPSEFTEYNDGSDQLSGYANLTGVSSSNCEAVLDKYRLYFSVIDEGGGDYSVSIYNSSDRGAGDKIGHTAAYSSTGSQAITADNSSGLGGAITVDTVSGADADIYVEFEFGGENWETDNAYRTGTGRLSSFAATQMARDADILLECVSAATAGSEKWRAYRKVDDQDGEVESASNQITTATAWPEDGDPDEFGVELTIAAPAEIIVNDGSSQLSSPAFTGAARGTNCESTSGRLYCKLLGTGVAAPTDTNDGSDQLAGWTFSGAVKGTNTDSDGKVYIDLTGKSATISEANDGDDQLSGYDGITGLVHGTNTDSDGKVYFEVVDEGGGDWRVDVFSDAARTSLVAHTATVTASSTDEALVEDNSSGLGGTIDIAEPGGGFVADADIAVTFPFVQVSVYSDSGRTSLVAQSSWTLGTDNGAPADTEFALAEKNSSALSGTVDVTYSGDDADIYVTLPFVRFEVYSDSGRSSLVAAYPDSATAYQYDADAAVSSAAVAAQNSSGLSGTIDIDYSTNDSDIVILSEIAFAVGDVFRLRTTTDDAGTFQKFFRDYLGRALPSNSAGSETRADSLAE